MDKAAEVFFNKTLAPLMDRLQNRWRDEKNYEDWRDYEKVIRDFFVKQCDFRLIKVDKTPFSVHFYHKDVKYVAKCSPKRIELEEVIGGETKPSRRR